MVEEGNDESLKGNDEEEVELDEAIVQVSVNAIEVDPDSWYADLKLLLVTRLPPEGLNPKQKWALKLKSEPYQLVQSIMFRSNQEGVLLRCLEKEHSI